MSLSKIRTEIPYYQYPYRWTDKIRYHGSKIICYFLDVTCISAISAKSRYPTYDKSTEDLMQYLNISASKLSSYFQRQLILGFIGGGLLYHTNSMTCISTYSFYLGGIIAGLFIIDTIWALSHWRNYLGYADNLRSTLHWIQVTRALNAITAETQSFRMKDIQEWGQKDIQNLLYDKLITRICQWDIRKDISPDTNEIYYVVFNFYYENLFFLFSVECTSRAFLTEVRKMDCHQVRAMANNPSQAQEFQDLFIKSRIHMLIFDHYYNACQ